MVPSLPHELSDHIIDFLYDDCLALSACSLSCSAFLAATRYHRFSVTCVFGRLGPFVDLLDASPGIAAFVRTLRLDGVSYPLRRQVDPGALVDTLGRLPALNHLSLRNLKLDNALVSALNKSTDFKHLHGLDLHRCIFDSADDLVHVISVPPLEHLAFEELDYPYDEFDEPCPLSPAITSLCIYGLWDEIMVKLANWLIAGTGYTSVRTLRTIFTTRLEADQVADLLRTLGEALQHLEVVVDPTSNLQDVFNESKFLLSCLPRLRRCHWTFQLREMFVAGTASIPWINSSIIQISSRSLEELVICIQADDMEDLRALDSECGVRAISPVRFEDLRLLDWQGIHQTFIGSALKRVVVEGRGNPSILRAHITEQSRELNALVQLRQITYAL